MPYPGNSRFETVRILACDRIKACMNADGEELVDLLDDPVTFLAAFFAFDDQASHQCYWNDRFCIALACELPEYLQRRAVWCAVSNGINGYWEWHTHDGYDAAKVLSRIGVDLSAEDPTTGPDHYCRMSARLIRILVTKFNLPTIFGGMKAVLTEADEHERKCFNSKYPYNAVL